MGSNPIPGTTCLISIRAWCRADWRPPRCARRQPCGQPTAPLTLASTRSPTVWRSDLEWSGAFGRLVVESAANALEPVRPPNGPGWPALPRQRLRMAREPGGRRVPALTSRLAPHGWGKPSRPQPQSTETRPPPDRRTYHKSQDPQPCPEDKLVQQNRGRTHRQGHDEANGDHEGQYRYLAPTRIAHWPTTVIPASPWSHFGAWPVTCPHPVHATPFGHGASLARWAKEHKRLGPARYHDLHEAPPPLAPTLPLAGLTADLTAMRSRVAVFSRPGYLDGRGSHR